MPTYSFKCTECETQYDEFFTSVKSAEKEEAELVCPKCGSNKKTREIVQTMGHIFNSGGWYKDGYSSKKNK